MLCSRFYKNIVRKKLFIIEGLESEEHSKQNRDQNAYLPDGYAFEGVYFRFEFDEFRFQSLMAVAVDGVFEGFEAFGYVFDFLFEDFVHLPSVNAFLVMPAPMYAEIRLAISSFQTSAK